MLLAQSLFAYSSVLDDIQQLDEWSQPMLNHIYLYHSYHLQAQPAIQTVDSFQQDKQLNYKLIINSSIIQSKMISSFQYLITLIILSIPTYLYYYMTQQSFIDSLNNKTIAIVSIHNLTAKLILKKILSLTSNVHIIAIQIGKDSLRRNKFLNDQYFTPQERATIGQVVSFVSYGELAGKLGNKQIDILLSLFEQIDFSNKQQFIQYHVINPGLISSALEKVTIKKCIQLSTIYSKQSGYVPEQDNDDEVPIIQKFNNKQQAMVYVNDNFSTGIEAWKWSINYMEKCYKKISENTIILRVPSLGPTITNYQGYTTKFNYFTYLIYQLGTGLIRNIDGHRQNKIDIIPNDYVSNLILVLAVKDFVMKNQTLNLSTTTRNYITLQKFIEYGQEAWQQNGVKSPKINITEKVINQKIRQIRQNLPSNVKKRLGNMFDLKSWKIEGARQSHEIEQKLTIIQKYRFFLQKEWLCESIKSIDIFNQLSPDEQVLFNFNINSINWRSYIRLCIYSIRKYLLNHDVQEFKPHSIDLLSRESHPYFSDIMWAMKQGKVAKGQTSKQALHHVLHSKAVKEAIKSAVEAQILKLQNSQGSYQKLQEQITKVAEQMCLQMFSDYSMNSIRMFAWFLHKVFGTIYQKVVVDKEAIDKIKAHIDTVDGPLIIIPTHRSYIDFLIISFVFFSNAIKCPHIAAAEDFLGMAGVHILLRKSGAFFIKRNQKKYRQLYKAVMAEYVSKLLVGNHFLQFFIQGTRSRTGKILSPKFGLLSLVVNNVAQNRISDAKILPVTVNYEKVLEGNSFTYQMMGQAKVKESLSRLLKAAEVLKQNYGRIYIEICDKISVKEWINTCKAPTLQEKTEKLGNKILFDMSRKLVVTGQAIVSSIVLMDRKGISDDSLQQKTSWLSKEISSRGVKITRSQADSSISVGTAISLLEGTIQKSKKNMFQVIVSFDQNSFVKLFNLVYYRNTLGHLFFEQSIIITALASFGHSNIITKTVNKQQLYTETCFLWNLLQNEYYLQTNLNNLERFNELLNLLVKKLVIRIQDNFIIAVNLSGNQFNFYTSLIWPLTESYWTTCLYLFKLLKNNNTDSLNKFLTEIQWFAQSLFNQRICSHIESISLDTIKNSVAKFTKMKIILQVKNDSSDTIGIKINSNDLNLSKLLEKIQSFLKSSYAKSVKGILGYNQGSMNIDFPFLSKL